MTPATEEARRFATRLALLTAVAAGLRLLALPGQPPLADDLSAAVSAVNFLERAQVGPTMWQHPRLRDLLVYVALWACGPSKLGLVLPSLLIGVAGVPVIGLLARRFGGDRAGLLAALLLAIDPLHVDYSRQAVQEVYTTLFGAAGVLTALRFLDGRRAGWAVASGLLFGLGLATKWSVALPLAVTVLWTLWRAGSDRSAAAPARRAQLALLAVSLLLLPAAVYLATWAPWFRGGRSLVDWIDLQRAMATEAAHHAGFNAADSEQPHRAARWFLWPTAYADAAFGPAGPVPIVAISNPLTWLPTLPAAAWLVREARRAGRPDLALLPALVAATWLPFALASRPIWLHSALAVLPFALAAVAVAAARLAAAARDGSRRLLAYALLATLAAAPLVLLAAGLARDVPGLDDVVRSYRPASSEPAAPSP
ncbi:MAG TPA: glycosyltransferase family 39 protein [Anaeromyxobacteraceae bacterium]|nr:glycosyltransferase family 39 protein [Anaeromyxobacteraceae bacterium]